MDRTEALKLAFIRDFAPADVGKALYFKVRLEELLQESKGNV